MSVQAASVLLLILPLSLFHLFKLKVIKTGSGDFVWLLDPFLRCFAIYFDACLCVLACHRFTKFLALCDRSQPGNGFTVPAQNKDSDNFPIFPHDLYVSFAFSLCASKIYLIQLRSRFFKVYVSLQFVPHKIQVFLLSCIFYVVHIQKERTCFAVHELAFLTRYFLTHFL